MKKSPRTYRLTDEAVDLVEKLTTTLGISATAVVELAIREFAKKEHIK